MQKEEKEPPGMVLHGFCVDACAAEWNVYVCLLLVEEPRGLEGARAHLKCGCCSGGPSCVSWVTEHQRRFQ